MLFLSLHTARSCSPRHLLIHLCEVGRPLNTADARCLAQGRLKLAANTEKQARRLIVSADVRKKCRSGPEMLRSTAVIVASQRHQSASGIRPASDATRLESPPDSRSELKDAKATREQTAFQSSLASRSMFADDNLLREYFISCSLFLDVRVSVKFLAERSACLAFRRSSWYVRAAIPLPSHMVL